ncbi:Glyoxylate reductase [Penicillium herquei]|nr:Glyoxylate reductase [Penicillium herquei]
MSLDPDGGAGRSCFVGSPSSLNFLQNLQQRLRSEAQGGEDTSPSIFNLGDTTLPEFNERVFVLPSRQEAESMIKTYFEITSPTYKFLHRPTVEKWTREIYEKGTVMEEHAHSKYAVVLMVFARATRYNSAASNTANTETGLNYFQAAERNLSRGLHPASLSCVQALLGCSFYLLTRHRLNECWTWFGTTARLILALGLHRKTLNVNSRQRDLVDEECGRRVFWCAYNIDKYLSTIFGRPCAFHDDDIDQDMPAVVEDVDLSAQSLNDASWNKMNTMIAPLCHQKLGRILGKALRYLYGIKPLDRETLFQRIEELGTEVATWRQNLPPFLNQGEVDPRLLVQPFRIQSHLLGLASGHLEILIFRPSLFNNSQPQALPSDSGRSREYVYKCLRAALNVVGIISNISEAGQFSSASWFANYAAFCAVVVLYTYTIQNGHEDSLVWLEYFRAAERCRELVANLSTIDSLAKRYLIIMEEFRQEVIRHLLHSSLSPSLTLELELDQVSITPFYGEAHVDNSMNTDNFDCLNFCDVANWEAWSSLAHELGDFIPDLGSLPAESTSGVRTESGEA